MSKGYHVVWEIDVDAESPWQAARKALDIQRDQNSMATVFDVTEHDQEDTVRIDLLEDSPRDELVCVKCGHTARLHYDPRDGYIGCQLEHCTCDWFNIDQETWEASK